MWLAVIYSFYSLPVPHKFNRLIVPRRCCYTTGFSAGQGLLRYMVFIKSRTLTDDATVTASSQSVSRSIAQSRHDEAEQN